MTFLKPYDSVHKIVSLPRWQRDWYVNNPTVKFSSLIQEEITLPLIQKRDIDYYVKFMTKK
jgi:hypothetical protein